MNNRNDRYELIYRKYYPVATFQDKPCLTIKERTWDWDYRFPAENDEKAWEEVRRFIDELNEEFGLTNGEDLFKYRILSFVKRLDETW